MDCETQNVQSGLYLDFSISIFIYSAPCSPWLTIVCMCVCVNVCVRACLRAYVPACVRVCVGGGLSEL